jgi:5'-nucleotidase
MRNTTLSLVFLIGLISFVAGLLAQEEAPSPSPLRILVANDDGIDSPGLHALVLALSEIGEVVVSAPEENCSGASHSTIVFSGTHRAKQIDMPGAIKAWAVEGTPSDAVTWGVLMEGSETKFDYVVSGINGGPNVGEIAHYSGTIGAAMEGAGLGIPAIAVSQSRQGSHVVSCKVVVNLITRLEEKGAPSGIVWAVEVPKVDADKWPEIAVAPMSGRYVQAVGFDTKENEDGEGLIFRPQLKFEREFEEGGSSAAFMAGKVVITPLRYDWSAYDEIERLREWDWDGD